MDVRTWPTWWQIPALILSLLCGSTCSAGTQKFDPRDPHSPLQLARSIELPGVKGRIDHMALDNVRGRLFVAEYGNGSVDEIDLASGKIGTRITGLHEPQGIVWLPKEQEIAVACGDGSLRFFRGADHRQVARIELGGDADNVRLDPRNDHLIVGYGSGGLAIVDAAAHRVVRELKLKAHPEAFALVGSRVFVNVPDAHEIIVADLDKVRVISTLDTGQFAGNYPMAVDDAGSRIAVAYRSPGNLLVMDAGTATTLYSVPICLDADDLYFHGRDLVVVCGQGAVELIEEGDRHQSARVATRRGARTGLIDPVHNSLIVALPGEGEASIWQLKFR